jgi:hypothetical protein
MVSGTRRSLLITAVVLLGVSYDPSTAAALSPQSAWSAYKGLLSARPLLTKSVTSAVLAGVSDSLTQRVESKIANDDTCHRHDWIRTSHILTTGFVYSGPISHYWFALLERIVKFQNPVLGLAGRLLLDALLFSPFTIAGYFTIRTLLEGKGYDAIRLKLQRAWAKSVLAAWKFWPAVNVVNFSIVPLPYRVLYVNVMALLWMGYLSFVNAQKSMQHKT